MAEMPRTVSVPVARGFSVDFILEDEVGAAVYRMKPITDRITFQRMVVKFYDIPLHVIYGRSKLHNGRKPTARRKKR